MDLSEIKDRLSEARRNAGLSQRDVSERTGLSIKVIGAHEEGRNLGRGLIQKYAEKYARAYGVSALWLSHGIGTPIQTKRLEGIRVCVRGALQAGLWSSDFDWSPEDQYEIWVNRTPELERETLYAAEVRGPSMNRAYPDHTIVILKRRVEGLDDLISGKRYHVERIRSDGLVENTIKTLIRRKDGTLWLQPESDDPEYSASVQVKTSSRETISFVGRVVQAIINE
jgi:transcriptional regulator with XRE-family HTH domain